MPLLGWLRLFTPYHVQSKTPGFLPSPPKQPFPPTCHLRKPPEHHTGAEAKVLGATLNLSHPYPLGHLSSPPSPTWMPARTGLLASTPILHSPFSPRHQERALSRVNRVTPLTYLKISNHFPWHLLFIPNPLIGPYKALQNLVLPASPSPLTCLPLPHFALTIPTSSVPRTSQAGFCLRTFALAFS